LFGRTNPHNLAMNCQAAITATTLNNEGIESLKAKSYQQAMNLFSRGLSLVKQVLAEHEDEMDQDEEGKDQEMPCQFIRPELDISKTCTGAEYSSGFIFRSAMTVPLCSENEPLCFKVYVQLSFVLLYNLALGHHLSALNSNEREKELHKALCLYELAYTIQMAEGIELTVLQTMAIINNLGQIHWILGSEEKSRQCFQHLLSTIMFLNDCGDSAVVENLEGFLCNVLPLISNNVCASAA
jgi:tetratricopeptide (TPR) repeat protein